jgi:hypothetical protein
MQYRCGAYTVWAGQLSFSDVVSGLRLEQISSNVAAPMAIGTEIGRPGAVCQAGLFRRLGGGVKGERNLILEQVDIGDDDAGVLQLLGDLLGNDDAVDRLAVGDVLGHPRHVSDDLADDRIGGLWRA